LQDGKKFAVPEAARAALSTKRIYCYYGMNAIVIDVHPYCLVHNPSAPLTVMEKSPIKILIADDENNVRKVFCIELSAGGADVDESENGLRTLELLEKKEYDVLLLDLNMPGLGGIDVLKRMKTLEIPTEVIILTANATVATAVEAMKLGAYDYLTKPFSLEELSTIIEKASEKKRLYRENVLLKTQIKRETEGKPLIGKSRIMLDLLATIKQVASTDLPVLITGESGTGKEHIARIIHRDSPRAEQPFLAINCGALPESMVESELFGYEKGAFTGAHARKPGLLEIAHKGTLLLDEIGDMPAPLQVKLLRVIETGSFFRLGGIREMKVNVRLVSATNKSLQAEIEKGAFRQDLFYRVAAFTVHIPPLREGERTSRCSSSISSATAKPLNTRTSAKKLLGFCPTTLGPEMSESCGT
jgi:DNA-binding NtrC family response regulator